MTPETYDVIIIGGGFAGVSIAYHLAQRGVDVLLLEANGVGSGTSGACAGRAQLMESHSGPHLDLVLDGMARLDRLEAELDFPFEWRRLGNLMLIDRESHWEEWTERVGHLQQRGVQAQMLSTEELTEIEPQLRAERFLGGAWCLEGHLNPFKYVQAYAVAARRAGAVIRENERVTRLSLERGRITAVHTSTTSFTAGTVLLTAGAWTAELAAMAGAVLPVQYTHAEAMISERLPPLLRNHVGLADFYETIHNARQAVSIGVAQQKIGSLLITEAVQMGVGLRRDNSHWGIPGMAQGLLELFPALHRVRVMRAWAAPSPFLPDEQPAIGWMPGCSNLFVATCFHLTITTIPVISELISEMIVTTETPPALRAFSPTRFAMETNS